MRVYDLAKQLELTNKELLDKMHSMGIEAKSHSSSLDDKTVRQVLERLGKGDMVIAPEGKSPDQAKEDSKKEAALPPKPKIDARAIALEAIARAKARRAQEQQRHQEEAPKEEPKAPPAQDVDLGTKKPALKPPQPQGVVAPKPQPAVTPPPVPSAAQPPAPAAPAAAAPVAPAPPAPPKTPEPAIQPPPAAPRQPAVEERRPPSPQGREQQQQPRPYQPRPQQPYRQGDQGGAPRQQQYRPGDQGGQRQPYRQGDQGGQRQPYRQGDQGGPSRQPYRPGDQGGPQRPRPAGYGGPSGDRDRREGPSGGPNLRRPVELKQLPSLPKGRPPVDRHRKDKEDLVAPTFEVMKLKPSRRVAAKKVEAPAHDEDAAEKERKRLLKEKTAHDKKIRPGRFLTVDAIDEVEEEIAGAPKSFKVRPSIILDKDKQPYRPQGRQTAVLEREPVVVKIHGDVTVGEFAAKIQVTPAEIITKGMEIGEMLTLNKVISPELCEILANEFKVKIDIIAENDESDVQEFVQAESQERMQGRPPVVTVMGHVDHGKTTLLDAIRKTNIAGGEFGGITQHIGAYHVETARGEIVFLDTPGHEAFTAMRARGASVTDIVILVVAADDGLMPQTIEAINHAKAANVPIIVAINKIDLPAAAPQKVRNALMQYSLVGEDLGGDTIICEVSAKAGMGIDNLLEMVLLQAEVMELKADPTTKASGVVIESEIDPLRGINATVLIQRGTLRGGDAFVCGDVSGRVRAMLDDLGQAVESALPAHPVRILGLDGCPQVGEKFLVLDSERQARQIAQVRETRRRRQQQRASERPHVTLESLGDYLNQDDKPKTLNIVLKGDVQGSVEAVSQALLRLSTPKVNIQILHSGVGAVTESDVQLAMASDAVIIGFNVRPDSAAAELATQEEIDIKTYRVIYNLIEEMQAAMLGMLDKKFKEVPRGKAEVRQVFRISRFGSVAGCYVTTGTIARNDKARLVRDGVVVFESTISTLRRVKEDVGTVQAGYECGMTLADYQDYKEGDTIETYRLEEVAQVL